jgi:ABC-type proline/glycine betaine transport system permease subunit
MNNTNNEENKRRQMESVRTVWLILIPIFALLVLFMLYNWSNGDGRLTSIFSPLAFICIGLSNLFSTKNRTLQYLFLAIGVTLAFTGLILLFAY